MSEATAPAMRDYALAVAAAGYRIVPLRAGMKAPPPRGWPKLATNDAARIAESWGQQPQANIGIVCGDGLLVLDVDTRKGGDASLASLETKHGKLPATMTALTPSGGWHLYFNGPDVENSSNKIGAGLDIKSRNGYVVAPPSFTVAVPNKQSEGHYRWALPMRPIALAPQWLIDAAGAPKGMMTARTTSVPLREATPQQWADIRSALDHLAKVPDVASNQLWSDIGYSLLCLGAEGRALWCDWSQRAPGYGGSITPEAWWAAHDANSARSNFRTLFAIAGKHGWKNPNPAGDPSTIQWGGPPPSGASARPPTAPNVPAPPNEWVEPIDFFAGNLEAPPFDGSEFPPEISAYPLMFSRETGFDPSLTLNAALVVMAAAIPDGLQLCVNPRSKYYVQARLWGLAIAPPGAAKSPAHRAMLGPLRILHRELNALYLEMLRDWEGEEKGSRGPKPARPRVVIDDVTVEALANVLEDNERGVLVASDEFATWLGAMDRYKAGGVPGRDRGDWLKAYDGGPHPIERISRGTQLVLNWGVSILTATTTSQIRDFAKYLPEDGLIQRFNITLVRRRRIILENRPSDQEIDEAANAYETTLRRLWGLSSGGVVLLAPEARAAFDEFDAKNQELVEALAEIEPALAGHVAKHPMMALRIALTYHCAQVVNRAPHQSGLYMPAAYEVSRETIERALAFLKRSTQHARALYLNRSGGSSALEVARSIARFVLSKSTAGVLQRRDLLRHVKAYTGADEPVQAAAVRIVIDCGWLRVQEEGGYQKQQPTRFLVNPRVAAKFVEQIAAERARRKLIREQIAESASIRRESGDSELS